MRVRLFSFYLLSLQYYEGFFYEYIVVISIEIVIGLYFRHICWGWSNVLCKKVVVLAVVPLQSDNKLNLLIKLNVS